MKLVNILCKDCRHHHDFYVENQMEYTLQSPQGKIVQGEARPEKGFVFCEKLSMESSAGEFKLQMPIDGFCSYGEPIELVDITDKDKP